MDDCARRARKMFGLSDPSETVNKEPPNLFSALRAESRRKVVAIALVAITCTAGVATVSMTTADAANKAAAPSADCTKNVDKKTYKGNTYMSFWCDSWLEAPVYPAANGDRAPQDANRPMGFMRPGRNWYICQDTADNAASHQTTTNGDGSRNINNRVVYTKADGSRSADYGLSDGWGWVPATFISQGSDNSAIPGLPTCSDLWGNGTSKPQAETKPAADTQPPAEHTATRSAGDSCDSSGETQRTYKGNKYETFYCDMFLSAPVYPAANGDVRPQETNIPMGHLGPGRRWFVCQAQIDNGFSHETSKNRDGSVNHNNRIIYTQTDDVAPGREADHKLSGGWGWVPATYISQGANNADVPGLPDCSTMGKQFLPRY